MIDQQPPRYRSYGEPAAAEPTQGYSGGPPGHAQVSPKKKHRMRTGCLSALVI